MLKQVANVFAFVGGLMALAAVSTAAAQSPSADASNPHLIVYRGDKGPGLGKQIVFLAGDHEYRSEESLPMLARMLAKHYGFTCKVFITTDQKTGFINPGSSNISGLEALKTADLLVIFLRFQSTRGTARKPTMSAASDARFSARRGCRTTARITNRARGWCCRRQTRHPRRRPFCAA
jgi:hypothetical protein